jgi:selenocysteine lyase/cysteine desulfurase
LYQTPTRLELDGVVQTLAEQNIITAPRGDRLRIAPHFYNNREDIDALRLVREDVA